MIRSKMEMPNLIRSLNELQKLKLLLFDEEQLLLFEHIPKPLLIDPNLLQDEAYDDSDEEEEEESKLGQKVSSKEKKKKSELLLSNDRGFW